MEATVINRKLFPSDKNYLLKEAQHQLRQDLLQWTVRYVRQYYLGQSNPLGIKDDTILFIEESPKREIQHLNDFYDDLAGIYRYKFGDAQLEFLFDGTDHYDKYLRDWEASYREWIKTFVLQRHFVRAVLDASILFPEVRVAELAGVRLQHFLYVHFGLKVYRYKGIQEYKAA